MNVGNSLNIERSIVYQLLLAALAFTLVVLCSCASGQGTAPPGGPPDSTAPAIVATSPPNGTTNFRGTSVTVEFSEFVQESNVQGATVITPIPAHVPKFDWSGRELEIEFRDPLLENRTYAITFGAEITDLANNRLRTPLTLRFSTGDVIDSGRITGTVSGVGRRRAFIFGYLVPADTSGITNALRPDSTRPDFIAPVGDDGTFSLEALPTGTFRLYAVTDEAGDQLYSPGTDAFGVATSDARLESQSVPVSGIALRLRPAPVDQLAPTLFSATSLDRSRTLLRFNEPIDTATLRPENFTITTSAGEAAIKSAWRSTGNWVAVEVAHAELPEDSSATVSTRNLRDTVGNALPDSAATATFTVTDVRDTIPASFLPLAVDSVRTYSFPDSIVITFTEAVEVTSPDATVTMLDTSGHRATFRLRRLSPTRFSAVPRDSLIGVSRVTLQVNLGSFSDLAGNRIDSMVRLPVAVAPARQNGTMEGTLADTAAPNAAHVIIVRLTATGATFRKTGVRAEAWEFPSIPEGEYEVTAFRDTDNDGEYDYGSIVPYRPAEAFTAWKGTVRVRPRWVTNAVNLVVGK